MSLPVSIGDAVLISQLAIRLAKKLTTERHAASSEYQEIQNQLFALSTALEHVERVNTSENGFGSSDTKDQVKRILENCRNVLKRMEGLVNKYAGIDPTVSAAPAQSGKRVSATAKLQWKRIMWTNETDSLKKIKEELTLYLNTLQSLLASTTSTQTQDINETVTKMQEQLGDIYDWFTRYLRKPPEGLALDSPPVRSVTGAETVVDDLTFRLYDNLAHDDDSTLLCPNAAFSDGWLLNKPGSSMFVCRCAYKQPIMQSHVLHFKLLPVSLVVRLCEHDNAWQMFCGSQSTTSVLIKGVSPSRLQEFEEKIHTLALYQAKRNLRLGRDSMQVFQSRTLDGRRVISALDTMGSSTVFRGQITSLSFVSKSTRFTQPNIDTVQLLHYKSIPLSTDAPSSLDEADTSLMSHQSYGEIVFYPPSSDATTYRFVVNVSHSTEIGRSEDFRSVRLMRVTCTSEPVATNIEPTRLDDIMVEIEFVSLRVAQEFLSVVEALQRHLRIYHLQFPELGDHIIAQSLIGDRMISEFYIPDAQLTLVQTQNTDFYRLILLSASHSTSVCMEFPGSYMRRRFMNGEKHVDPSSARLPAHFVQHHERGTNVFVRHLEMDTIALPFDDISLIERSEEMN